MAEDPNHPWGTGKTTYSWRPEVRRVVQSVLNEFSAVTANSYVCHPWCGWSRLSADFWGEGGRGHALPDHLGPDVRSFLLTRRGKPLIRHMIWEHELWTSWGGYSYWRANDHSGRLRHLHVTYWP